MSRVMERESRSLYAALEAADPELALREAVRDMLRSGQSRQTVLGVLGEFSEKLDEQPRDWILDIMDVVSGWASSYAISSFFEGLPEEAPPGRPSDRRRSY